MDSHVEARLVSPSRIDCFFARFSIASLRYDTAAEKREGGQRKSDHQKNFHPREELRRIDHTLVWRSSGATSPGATVSAGRVACGAVRVGDCESCVQVLSFRLFTECPLAPFFIFLRRPLPGAGERVVLALSVFAPGVRSCLLSWKHVSIGRCPVTIFLGDSMITQTMICVPIYTDSSSFLPHLCRQAEHVIMLGQNTGWMKLGVQFSSHTRACVSSRAATLPQQRYNRTKHLVLQELSLGVSPADCYLANQPASFWRSSSQNRVSCSRREKFLAPAKRTSPMNHNVNIVTTAVRTNAPLVFCFVQKSTPEYVVCDLHTYSTWTIGSTQSPQQLCL